jgi:U3 small nucleolar RNA-associated protein 18
MDTFRSTSGFVNVYGSDSFTDADEKPKLMKSVANLTTPISTVKFNHDAQLMAIASGDKKDAMRLVGVIDPFPRHWLLKYG